VNDIFKTFGVKAGLLIRG